MKNTIYVRLLNEGNEVFRPVRAIPAGDEAYEIVQQQPGHEDWENKTGMKVICQTMNLSDGPCLVAAEKIS